MVAKKQRRTMQEARKQMRQQLQQLKRRKLKRAKRMTTHMVTMVKRKTKERMAIKATTWPISQSKSMMAS